MIYDELIEELALTLLTKARYEGCIRPATAPITTSMRITLWPRAKTKWQKAM